MTAAKTTMIRQPFGSRTSLILAVLGTALAFQGAIDPLRPWGGVLGPALAFGGVLVATRRRGPFRGPLLAAIFASLLAASSTIPIELRADSGWYLAYLRSMVFDGDLDFTNEWAAWGYPLDHRTPTGRPANAMSVGPAIFWSPFYLAAHVYLRIDQALFGPRYPLDGYGPPYQRAAAAGTLTVSFLGAVLLFFMISRHLGATTALLAVAGAVLTSPVIYYVFVVPLMAHGVSFGLAGAFLWGWDRARRDPDLRSWLLLGALLGALTLCRWQGLVYGLLLAPLAATLLAARAVRPGRLAAAAALALAVFSPQLFAWKALYGSWIVLPQGSGFLSWPSRYLVDTLFSANHGLFNWTPVMLVGFLGLPAGLRHDRLLHGGSLAVFVATAWVNGSVPYFDWDGGDAFGARRYSLVVPVLALGLGEAIALGAAILARAPLLAPACLLAAAALWNLGLVSHFRAGKYPEMAPFDRVAWDQARSFRSFWYGFLGRVAGDRGRAFAYKVFSAEYLYTQFNRDGAIYLRTADDRYLMSGWSTPSRRTARPGFRRALFPEACVRIPLEEPFEIPATVSARAPDGLDSQVMAIHLNGKRLVSARLTTAWREIPVVMPAEWLAAGENALCFRFASALPGENGERVAAHVERIQLP